MPDGRIQAREMKTWVWAGAGITGLPMPVALTGLVRMVLALLSLGLIANYFGTTRQLDIYFTALACPSMALSVVVAMAGTGVMPVPASVRDLGRPGRVPSRLPISVLVIAPAIAFGGMVMGKELLAWTTSLRGEELEYGGRLAGLIWLVVGLEAMNAFLASLHQTGTRSCLPALLSVFPVIGTIGGAVFLSGGMGVSGLVAGWICMDVLSLALLSGALLKGRLSGLRMMALSGGNAAGDLARLLPMSLTMLPLTALPVMDAYYASGLPEGSMSFLGYSTRAVTVIGALVAGGTGALLAPCRPGEAKGVDADSSISRLRASLKAAFMVLAPAALFCYFYREPLVSLLMQRGAFDARSLAGVSGVLPYYLSGMVAMSLSTLVAQAYAARGRRGRLFLMSAVMIALYFLMAGTLSRRFSFTGIGMAYASYWYLYLLAGALALGGSVIDRELLTSWARTAVNSVTAVALSYALSLHMPFNTSTVLALCSVVTVSVLVLMNSRAKSTSPSATSGVRCNAG